MPTAMTHAAVGAGFGQFLPRDFPVGRLSLYLALVSALPDLDVLAFRFGIPYAAPFGHRGFTHSLLFALILATATALALFASRRDAGHACLGLGFITFFAVASHGFLDAATDAGLGVGFFIPFDNHRYFLPFRPIETSAVNPAVFLAHPTRAWAILSNEFRWVWIPLLLFTGIFQGMRFGLRKLRNRC